MTLERPPHFEHNAVFIQTVLPKRFWYDPKAGRIVGQLHNCPIQTPFEDLPVGAQTEAAVILGFDPEKLGIESIGKIVRVVRAGLNFLEDFPDLDEGMARLEALLYYGPTDGGQAS